MDVVVIVVLVLDVVVVVVVVVEAIAAKGVAIMYGDIQLVSCTNPFGFDPQLGVAEMISAVTHHEISGPQLGTLTLLQDCHFPIRFHCVPFFCSIME